VISSWQPNKPLQVVSGERLTCAVSQCQDGAVDKPTVAGQCVALVVVRSAEHDVRDEPVVCRRLSGVVQLHVAHESDWALSQQECRSVVRTRKTRLQRFVQLHVRRTSSRACVQKKTT